MRISFPGVVSPAGPAFNENESKHTDAVEKLLKRLPWEVEPDGPEVYALAREFCATWRTNQRRAWQTERATTFESRVGAEHERLVKVFAGPIGLDPDYWPRVPRKLELVAQRNVQREDTAEKERREVEAWDTRVMLRNLVYDLNAALRARLSANPMGAPPGFVVEPPPPKPGQQPPSGGAGGAEGGAGQNQGARMSLAAIALLKRTTTRAKAAHMDSMQRELAISIVQRMRTMGRSMGRNSYEAVEEGDEESGSEYDEDGQRIDRHAEEEYAMMRRLAQGMKNSMSMASQRRSYSMHAMRAEHSSAAALPPADGSTGAGEMVLLGSGSGAGPGGGFGSHEPDAPGYDPRRISSSTLLLERTLQDSNGAPGVGEGGTTARARALATRASTAGSVFSVATYVGRSSQAGGPGRSSLRSLGAISSMLGGGSGAAGSNRRSSAAARAAKKVVVSPLVQSYLDACKASGCAHSQQVADQLGVSEATGILSLEGAALPDGAATSLASVLPSCKHLKSIVFTRTVLNASAVAALLPSMRVLRLERVELSAADIPPEGWTHLVDAIARPTATLVKPPSEWWMCMKTLSLEGNPLGDRGLAVLLDALAGMRALTHLSLSHTSLTEWSAPLLASLLRSEAAAKLRSLDLSGNQLGQQAGTALAAALPAATSLNSLNLSWNPMGGGVQHVLWALQGPRTGGSCHITHLTLAGCDLEADDHMALAALLKFGGHGSTRLRRLDLSHNALVGVSAQCLMRQLDALLPPLPALNQEAVQTAANSLASMVGSKSVAAAAAGQKHMASAVTSAVTSSKMVMGVPRLHLAEVIDAAHHTQRVGTGSHAADADPNAGKPDNRMSSRGIGALSSRSQVRGVRPGTATMAGAAGALSNRSQMGARSTRRASVISSMGGVSNAGSVASVAASLAAAAAAVSSALPCGRSSNSKSQPSGADRTASAGAATSMDGDSSAAGFGSSYASRQREIIEKSMQVLTLGCRVELDGGIPPTPRARAATGGAPANPVAMATVSAYAPPPPETRVTAALAVAWPTGTPRDRATMRRVPVMSHVAYGPGPQAGVSHSQPHLSQSDPSLAHHKAGQPTDHNNSQPEKSQEDVSDALPVAPPPPAPLQHFVLDLSRARPDRFVAQLLVEHELAGRVAHVQPPVWRTVILDGKVLRIEGSDVVPFDVLYRGWANPGAMPKAGRLELHVACVPQAAARWLQNPRLQFNATRLLEQGAGREDAQ